eukprot:5903188-Prymnesium_polylepis.1
MRQRGKLTAARRREGAGREGTTGQDQRVTQSVALTRAHAAIVCRCGLLLADHARVGRGGAGRTRHAVKLRAALREVGRRDDEARVASDGVAAPGGGGGDGLERRRRDGAKGEHVAHLVVEALGGVDDADGGDERGAAVELRDEADVGRVARRRAPAVGQAAFAGERGGGRVDVEVVAGVLARVELQRHAVGWQSAGVGPRVALVVRAGRGAPREPSEPRPPGDVGVHGAPVDCVGAAPTRRGRGLALVGRRRLDPKVGCGELAPQR